MRQLWLDFLVSSSRHGKNEIVQRPQNDILAFMEGFNLDSDAAEKTRITMHRE